MVYDLNVNKLVAKATEAHQDDINTLALQHDLGSNVIITGSDDCLVKVWDKRILRDSSSSVGMFVGHAEGITCLATREDDTYIASNAKD
jgi:WD repeat-containing protein 23